MTWWIAPLRWTKFLRRASLAALISPERRLAERLLALEAHLKAEQPDLESLLPLIRAFDRVLADLGLLGRGESLAARVAWWPTVSVLGLYSAGKSSFINTFLGVELQAAGNQAVDDLFTVITHGSGSSLAALPGSAINADIRFPFYRVADELDRIAADEGRNIDSYLQLKVCSSPRLKGRIIVDSPGFDAGEQRRGTLGIIEHIVEVSDLVLMFFDARRPEPGAMPDMLGHLVGPAANRADAGKLIYVLNHCDSTARDDNLDEVVGAWQRSLAQAGIVLTRFYCVYNTDAAPVIPDQAVQARYQARCTHDMAEIYARIAAVDAGRGHRLLGQLAALARELEQKVLPELESATTRWRRGVLAGGWPWWRGDVRREIASRLPERLESMGLGLRAAFLRNSGQAGTLVLGHPVGWPRARKAIPLLRHAVEHHTRLWNDRCVGLSSTPRPEQPAPKKGAQPRPPVPPSPPAGRPPLSPPVSWDEEPYSSPLLQTESLLAKAAGLFGAGRVAGRRKSRPPCRPRDDEDIDFFDG